MNNIPPILQGLASVRANAKRDLQERVNNQRPFQVLAADPFVEIPAEGLRDLQERANNQRPFEGALAADPFVEVGAGERNLFYNFLYVEVPLPVALSFSPVLLFIIVSAFPYATSNIVDTTHSMVKELWELLEENQEIVVSGMIMLVLAALFPSVLPVVIADIATYVLEETIGLEENQRIAKSILPLVPVALLVPSKLPFVFADISISVLEETILADVETQEICNIDNADVSFLSEDSLAGYCLNPEDEL